MTSFRFNFCKDVNVDQKTTEDETKSIQWFECEEIVPDKQLIEDDNITRCKMFTCCEVEIGHVLASNAMNLISDKDRNDTEVADQQHSDLITGKYEGGLKIWECTNDLIEYLIENKIEFENKQVLDLGCGAGILGIYALLNGSAVTFQDYNKEIIECVTIPNVSLNIDDDNKEFEIKNHKFYSGDWRAFNRHLSESQIYDIILTSETIYNIDNYEKILEIFEQRLKTNGMALVAAKTCYFGVGGGVRQFEDSISKNGLLQTTVVWKSTIGIQREILLIKRKL